MTNIIIATILSLFVPVLGQLYERQDFQKGIMFLIFGIVLYIIYIQ